MASLCKSQQCSIERRGFRQELDSWRHKLIHCVGFETILEGLFGSALLDDLSLFKDCEPTGVCDWSFDENCLFCCLRREKVKEHLAGFHKPNNESGQENFLKQEQAKIIRLERQAEEFINAVFYKKDSPRISDPNIPLVAREIMQRMIRQFAAEYTSKNSSTQDSSPPNSTKNQSLPKSPSGQSSPPPATTQNPVLSKLLMADQDSPLDLTVKKPHLEEPCEQDGVLDLSTKKSPCSGSPNSSISPSTSNNIGNGTQDTEKKAIDLNNSSLSLEMFIAKLCSHHQKQFILVLNNLCTEESIMKSKSRSASVSKTESRDSIDDYDHSCSDRKADLSLVAINKSYSESCLNCQVSINTPTNPHEDNYHSEKSHCSGYLSKVPISSDYEEDHANNISHAPDQTITYNPLGIPTTEEKRGTSFTKISDISQTVFLEHCVLLNSNSALNMLNDSPESELPTNIPESANKENTQYTPKQTHSDCNDCKLKQENSTTTATTKKLENHCESPFLDFADHSASSFQKIKLHENKRLNNIKCKNNRVLMTNDCDKQCDVVYISEPVTTECHFENHKSVACPRNTARKSTRGYLFSGNCCELSTVRTLVRSSNVEDRENSALHTSEALIIPNGLIETLPSTDILSLIHVEEKKIEIETFEPIPQNDEMAETLPNSSKKSETENCDPSQKMAKEPVEHISDSLADVFSLKQRESERTHVFSNHAEMAFHEHADEIPRMKLNSVINTDANSLSVDDLEKSVADLATDPNFDVSPSINSCNQEDSSGTQSLDMEVIVSLKNNHVLSESTPPECSPQNALMEEASATLQYSHASLSTAYSSSFPNGATDKHLSNAGSSSVVDAKILPEVITDPALSSDQQLIEMSSDCVPKENFESQISKTLQDNLSSSDIMINLNGHATHGVAKENVDFVNVNKSENVKDGQSVHFNDSVKMKITEMVPENIAIVQPLLDELQFPTADDLRPNERVHSPLNRCVKIVENITVKLEANCSKEDLNHCATVSSTECNKNYTFKKPLDIKVVNQESKLDNVSLDKIDNSLVYNKKTNRRLTPTKRHKKTPAPTDRCLRSHEAPDNPPFHKISSLQVLISYSTETNSAQRSVELRAEDAPRATANHFLVNETINDENYFAMFINSHCLEGKPLLYEKMLNCSSSFKISENLKICYETGSGKRGVSFATENHHNCLNMMETECKSSATCLRHTCQLQFKKCEKEIIENSNSISQPKNSNKQYTVKDKIMYSKSGELKNLSTQNKKINDCNNQINRPKFLDWCSEEENQERISSFNDKYSTVHKNWIPLEREMANVVKSKNKSDKLKEIWKTKKRVRRPKSVQDAQKCSPMQMLFMNSSKLSDICGWFMETTETKSLVIVKKLNTRLPEEHQLPMIQSPKYPSESLYPHILQAQRLKKHLKKFASVCPARNDLKTQNSLNKLIEDSSISLDQVSKDTVKGPNDGQKQEPHDKAKKTGLVDLPKYSRLRENLKYKPCTVNKNSLCMMNTKKVGNAENRKEKSPSESSLQKVPNSKKLKNKKNRRRSKNDSLIESVQLNLPTKKRKIEAKQGLLKNGLHVNKNVSPKTKVSKLSKTDINSNSQSPKKQAREAGIFKTSLRNGKAKTLMQKQSLKSQFVQRRMTRSAKRRQISPNCSDSTKITSLSSSHRIKELRKICTVSTKNKINVAPQVRQRKQRSQLEPSTRKRRSLEFK
ncbi:ligand-dependent corepressor isoform X2 [Phyllobates terribilis]|uniref:ligand-dependent corepressor isoform X2 n=1 Tax=Phyllobates terribilis TaxID=111132 RepID=UPI003CCA74B7